MIIQYYKNNIFLVSTTNNSPFYVPCSIRLSYLPPEKLCEYIHPKPPSQQKWQSRMLYMGTPHNSTPLTPPPQKLIYVLYFQYFPLNKGFGWKYLTKLTHRKTYFGMMPQVIKLFSLDLLYQ